MTAIETRIPLAHAEAVAAEIIDLLSPFADRIEIAGSVRRRKAFVSDIELVAIPLIDRRATDLFDTEFTEFDLLNQVCDRLLADHVLEQRLDINGRPRWGQRAKLMRYRDTPVDLFAVLPPAQWGLIYTIRTGPAEFNLQLVTAKSRGGLLPDHLMVRDGALYRHIAGADIPSDREVRKRYPQAWLTLVPTPEEADLFAAIGLEWIAPEDRR